MVEVSQPQTVADGSPQTFGFRGNGVYETTVSCNFAATKCNEGISGSGATNLMPNCGVIPVKISCEALALLDYGISARRVEGRYDARKRLNGQKLRAVAGSAESHEEVREKSLRE